MKRRHITPRLLAALRDTPVVFVQGPRQAGKTTLVQSLKDDGHDAAYFTFDDAAVLAAAQGDADSFVANLPQKVVLDEGQRVPDVLRAIKRSVDTRRQPGRFLLTGSANPLVLPKASESLVGRMEVLSLSPFSQGEIDGQPEHFVDACFARSFSPGNYRDSGWPGLTERIARGGYPEITTRPAGARREAWFGSYVTTILERDIRDIANRGLGPTSPRFSSGTYAISPMSKACAKCPSSFAWRPLAPAGSSISPNSPGTQRFRRPRFSATGLSSRPLSWCAACRHGRPTLARAWSKAPR